MHLLLQNAHVSARRKEERTMLSRLAVLLHTKVGVAVLGALVIAGGGAAVAVTSANADLGKTGSPASTATEHEGQQDSNHLSVEGTLTAFTPAARSTPGKIAVASHNETKT